MGASSAPGGQCCSVVATFSLVSPAASFGDLASTSRIASRDRAALDFQFDPSLAQRIELSHHPESDNCEVIIKRVSKPYSCTLHDDEASCVDSGQFVQVGAPEIFPRPLQIA